VPGLAYPHLHFDLSKLRDDLLSHTLFSAWHWLPPLVCSTHRFSLSKWCRLRGQVSFMIAVGKAVKPAMPKGGQLALSEVVM
jgi:hypothetical protein